jgi:branched-chain amino acid transport system permease protein
MLMSGEPLHPADRPADSDLTSKANKLRLAIWGALVVAAVAAPFVAKDFIIFQLSLVLIYAIAIMGLTVLSGFNGQFSLGHVAFFAIGAYTAAIMMDKGLAPYPLTLVAGGAISFVFGFLFGLPALRLAGIYLALATFALSVATPQLLKLTPLIPYTGGVNGISLVKPSAPFNLPISPDQWLYWFSLAVALLMLWGATTLMRSRSGRALMAIRDNPIAARSMGINSAVYKATAFGISGFYAGVAGALSAIVVQYVSPDSFNMHVSIAFFVGMVLGGYRWLPGAFFGGAFIVFMPQLSESFGKGSEGVAYGILLVVMVFLMPAGLGGMSTLVMARIKRRVVT